MRRDWCRLGLPLAAAIVLAGCNSPYHADRGALTGGLLGAGAGAIVGHALGSTAAGAAVGAGVGAISGGAIGAGMDEVEAENRAMLAAHEREIRAGTVTVNDVIAMTQAGVEPQLIINQIRANGMARVPGPQELIDLKRQGVDTAVIMAMQEAPPRRAVVRDYPPGPVVVERVYGGPYYYHHHDCDPFCAW